MLVTIEVEIYVETFCVDRLIQKAPRDQQKSEERAEMYLKNADGELCRTFFYRAQTVHF